MTKKTNPSAEAVREELTRELRHLREMVRDVGESFILRREGEIEAVISQIPSAPTALLRGEVAGWLRELHALKLKPQKGRLKDLKGIDRLIEEVSELLMSAQDHTGGGKG